MTSEPGPPGPQRRRRGGVAGVLLVVDRLEGAVERAHGEAHHDAVEQCDGEDQQQGHYDDGRNPRRRNAVELSDQKPHQPADELASSTKANRKTIDSTAVSGWSQKPRRGTPIKSRTSSCHTWEPDDREGLADQTDHDEDDPGPPRRRRAGVLRPQVADQPHAENAEPRNRSRLPRRSPDPGRAGRAGAATASATARRTPGRRPCRRTCSAEPTSRASPGLDRGSGPVAAASSVLVSVSVTTAP